MAKHLTALWRPQCQITGGNAGVWDFGILGELCVGRGVFSVRCKITFSSPYKGLLEQDRSWGFESQVRLPNSKSHLNAYLLLWTSANNLFLPWRTSSNPKDTDNLSPSANTTCPVAVAIAKGVSNTWWLVFMGMMLLLAQWYYNHVQLQCETTEWVNLHIASATHQPSPTPLLSWVHPSFESQFSSAAGNAAETVQCFFYCM